MFIFNFSEAFSFDIITAAESSTPRSVKIVKIINIPEEVIITGIDLSYHTQSMNIFYNFN